MPSYMQVYVCEDGGDRSVMPSTIGHEFRGGSQLERRLGQRVSEQRRTFGGC